MRCGCLTRALAEHTTLLAAPSADCHTSATGAASASTAPLAFDAAPPSSQKAGVLATVP